jgi:hypothetical protein
MKGRFSIVGARMMLGAFLTPDTVVAPTELYLALCGKLPTDGDGGSTLLEPDVAAGYARPAVPIGQQWWQSSGYGTFWNAVEIVFPPAQDIWQRTRAFALTTAPTSGEIVAMGESSLGNVPAGYQMVIARGGLQVVLRGSPL